MIELRPIRLLTVVLSALLFLNPLTGYAQDQAATSLRFTSDSEITVSGTSTIHDWSCTTGTLSGQFRLGSGESPAPGRIQGGSLTLPVEDLECTRSRMNDNTWEALQYEDHPEISFSLSELTANAEADGWTPLTATGELTVAGETRAVDLDARARTDDAGGIRVEGTADMTMTAFGVEPPTALLGTIKADDSVQVSFDVGLSPVSSSQASR